MIIELITAIIITVLIYEIIQFILFLIPEFMTKKK